MLHLLVLALQITVPQTSTPQLSAQAPTRVQAMGADPTGAQPISLAEFPTRKNPFTLTGKMTVTTAGPTYAPTGAGQGAMANEGLAEGGGGRGGKRGASSGSGGLSMRSSCSYAIQVPPGAKLKVSLNCRRLRSFNVRFISDTYGRTEDPGLFVNRLHHRDDVAFYENKDKEVRTIHCVLLGVEPMVDEPYSLVFTDY
jgi:hypothetical protein